MLALLTALLVPLSGDGWHHLSYSGTAQNQVTFAETKLTLTVDRSASPLFRAFLKPLFVHALSVSGAVSALPQLPKDKEEGESGADDYALRVGLVLQGEKGIGWLEKIFAPKWLKQLTELVAEDTQLDRVSFITLAQRTAPGTTRVHPKSRYLVEEVGARLGAPGSFRLTKRYDPPVPALGLWLQADGDDTQSRFDVEVRKIELEISERALTSPE